MANGLPPGVKTLATPEDICRETLWMLGARIDFGAGILIPAPTVGSLALFDLVKSPITCSGETWTPDRIKEAVFILCEGKLAASIVYDETERVPVEMEKVYDGASDAFKLFCGAFDSGVLKIAVVVDSLSKAMTGAVSGFSLLPKKRGTDEQDWPRFNSEWLARMIVTVSQSGLAVTMDQILWELPLCTVSHLVAAGAAKNGVTLRRPLDEDSVLAALEALNKT